jgi:hypothetical protein
MGIVVNNVRHNSSVFRRTHHQSKVHQINLNPEGELSMSNLFEKDRTTFYVNNFIKTRIRKQPSPIPSRPPPS